MASDSENGDLQDEMKTVIIRTFTSHDAANIARSNLEAHGIKCWVSADDCGGWYTNLTAPGGVRLSVRVSDAEAAIALLNSEALAAEISQIETEATSSVPSKAGPVKKLAWVQILVGIVMGVILYLLFQQIKHSGINYFYNYTLDGKCYEAFTYENGHLFETVRDRNLDGKWDAWIYYRNGRAVRAEYDNNFDGKADEWVTYSNASPITAEKDNDFNGKPDEFVTYSGAIQKIEIKPNGSTFATQRWLYQNGVLTEILRGGDKNGNFKEDVHYDPFFNPIPINFNPISSNAPTTFQLLSPTK